MKKSATASGIFLRSRLTMFSPFFCCMALMMVLKMIPFLVNRVTFDFFCEVDTVNAAKCNKFCFSITTLWLLFYFIFYRLLYLVHRLLCHSLLRSVILFFFYSAVARLPFATQFLSITLIAHCQLPTAFTHRQFPLPPPFINLPKILIFYLSNYHVFYQSCINFSPQCG